MKIAKLHKPQRMGNRESVIAYSGEEEDPSPSNAVPDSTATDSTGVEFTERGISTTSQDSTGRITFSINSPVWIATANDSTEVDSLRVSLTGAGGSGIDIAIPLHPIDPQPDPTPQPNEVEYDNLGRKRIH